MEQRLIRTEVLGTALELEAHDGLFSPRHIDRGTLAMLSVVPPEPGMRVMDLGCGYGVVGIAAARRCGAENVWMSDAIPRPPRPRGETRRATACPACTSPAATALTRSTRPAST